MYFCSTWTVWTNVLWRARVQRREARASFGLKGNKDFWRACFLCITARPAHTEQLGEGEGLMIACLPQCQMHLDCPTGSWKLDLAKPSTAYKKNPKQQDLIYWHIQCIVRACSVMLFIANEENELVWKICKANSVYVRTDNIFHFSINPLDMKAVEEKNRGEMNFFSEGWGKDYRDLLESVAHRRRRGAGKLFMTAQEQNCICTQQFTNYISRPTLRNKQSTRLGKINYKLKHFCAFAVK